VCTESLRTGSSGLERGYFVTAIPLSSVVARSLQAFVLNERFYLGRVELFALSLGTIDRGPTLREVRSVE
jgi:hypothetical protein